MNSILELHELTRIFQVGNVLSTNRITAVDHVSLHVGAAEILGIAGESGCGKSTIARMILGFEEPTSGTLVYRDREGQLVEGRKIWRAAGIQAVFQNPFETFNPLRRVERYFFDAVRNFRLASTREDAERRINEALNTVGLTYREIAGRYPSEFSGGQLQRISIGKALLTRPSLLIADEPVSMVDASLRMSIVNLFKKLKEDFGISVIYITHDLATAYYVCDRIAIMFRGNVVETGDVEKVLMQPRHPYIELLRDSIPQADPDKRWQTKTPLTESEREEYMRTGCKFAGRCPHVMDRCREELPRDISVNGVLVKCFLYDEAEAEGA